MTLFYHFYNVLDFKLDLKASLCFASELVGVSNYSQPT